MTDFFNSIGLEGWSFIIDAGLFLVTIAFPGVAIYASAAKKAKDELLQTINKVPLDNRSIKEVALKAGLKRAAKEIDKRLFFDPAWPRSK